MQARRRRGRASARFTSRARRLRRETIDVAHRAQREALAPPRRPPSRVPAARPRGRSALNRSTRQPEPARRSTRQAPAFAFRFRFAGAQLDADEGLAAHVQQPRGVVLHALREQLPVAVARRRRGRVREKMRREIHQADAGAAAARSFPGEASRRRRGREPGSSAGRAAAARAGRPRDASPPRRVASHRRPPQRVGFRFAEHQAQQQPPS